MNCPEVIGSQSESCFQIWTLKPDMYSRWSPCTHPPKRQGIKTGKDQNMRTAAWNIWNLEILFSGKERRNNALQNIIAGISGALILPLAGMGKHKELQLSYF